MCPDLRSCLFFLFSLFAILHFWCFNVPDLAARNEDVNLWWHLHQQQQQKKEPLLNWQGNVLAAAAAAPRRLGKVMKCEDNSTDDSLLQPGGVGESRKQSAATGGSFQNPSSLPPPVSIGAWRSRPAHQSGNGATPGWKFSFWRLPAILHNQLPEPR